MNKSPAPMECSFSPCDLARSHYQVPRGNNEYLIQPDSQHALELINRNRAEFNEATLNVWGKPLQAWRAAGRQQIVAAAARYTAGLNGLATLELPEIQAPLIATGHQPELFHPGVWTKNILAARLAEANQGISLNLIVDSDTVKSRSVSIPSVLHDQLTIRRIPIDDWRIGIPWQEQRVQNLSLFRSFADRVVSEMAPLRQTSVLPQYWESVLSTWQRSDHLVDALTAGRQTIEHDLGLFNLEIPLSRLCETPVFQEFMAGLILDADRFRQAYNWSLQRYRKTYQLKNESHPIPDLNQVAAAVELPFWIWSQDQPRRRGLYLRTSGNQRELTDLESFSVTIPASIGNPREHLAMFLGQLMQDGNRLRPRALMTTLFMRLFVSDWFIHGIGGAKYDEVTDAMIRTYWNISPPGFQVATGTIWLPLHDIPEQDRRSSSSLKQQLRYAEENPEAVVSTSVDPVWKDLLQRKKMAIIEQQQQRELNNGLSQSQRKQSRAVNLQRHQEFVKIRRSMSLLAAPELQQLRFELDKAGQLEQFWKVARYREYPFCCYPAGSLHTLADSLRSYGHSSGKPLTINEL